MKRIGNPAKRVFATLALYALAAPVSPAQTLTTLFRFSFDCADGCWPSAGLVQATTGDLYGTTWVGGTPGVGTVFQITPGGALTTIHTFEGHCCEGGANPEDAMVQAPMATFMGPR